MHLAEESDPTIRIDHCLNRLNHMQAPEARS
jgi:hypothetical protein